ncbi:sodium:proton antiporter [Ornithobacterium rhinotracheale]|uniref:sodium:proton antiporter NhaD n=1 Tax=Ornithobacterium rhinotracheale TaxID=28251 RepID=UPI00129CFD70|nr:sodium:proton antiporter NhaD [Ornithobacterium rhinotracheale]MRI63768.1 sodium:proton antiporter [Ornithobacterium rhinotracheale]
MDTLIVLVFIVGYVLITLEHTIKLDKTVPALIMAAVMWALLSTNLLTVYEINNGLVPIFEHLGIPDVGEAKLEAIEESLLHHLGKTAEILFFLIGAMTIVEIIDLHRGFEIIKDFVKTRSKRKLLWIVGVLAFFLSAIIDNLTATIVLITILRKIIPNKEERLWYAGLIVIAANAGGAWSPIGDVTTTMLWIAGKVSVAKLIEYLVIPAVLCFAVPFAVASFLPAFKGQVTPEEDADREKLPSSALMLYLGLGMIIFVPIFKTLTHLPPYVGMMLSLGVVWFAAEFVTNFKFDYNDCNTMEEVHEKKKNYSVHRALGRIEMSSILFFLGILMAVAALESLGMLFNFAEWLNTTIPQEEIVVLLLGIGSAVIDNVPLVAASIGMFNDPMDAELWHFIAYAAGTGGSLLIIGSAAGVAAMGMEKIDFFWYVKNISWLALIGFISGALLIITFKHLGMYDSVEPAVTLLQQLK